jgi:hypothetical protein
MSQQSITAAQQPEQPAYYESPPPQLTKKRHSTSQHSHPPQPPPPPVLFAFESSRQLDAPPAAAAAAVTATGESKMTTAEQAYDISLHQSKNLSIKRVTNMIDFMYSAGGFSIPVVNRHLSIGIVEELRKNGYHFHVSERQNCKHCELPINIEGHICWCLGVADDTPGLVVRNLCSCMVN